MRWLVQGDDPRGAADVLERSVGARFAWLVSQAQEPLRVQPQLAGGATLGPLGGAEGRPASGGDETVSLAPFGVSVSRLEDVPASG